MNRETMMFRLLAAGAALVIGSACGGGSPTRGGAAGAPGGAGGGTGAGGAGVGGSNACAPWLPTEPASLAAMLGLVEGQLVAAGRRDADFAAVFGDATPSVVAAADALQAQAVEVVAAARNIPLPDVPPVALPDPASCGATVSRLALSSTGQAWESATFLAVGNLLLAIDGETGDLSFPPLETQVTTPAGTTAMQQTTQLSLGLQKSHATATVVLTKTIRATDAGGKPLGDTFETATATIDVDFCPDTSGVSAGMISFTGNGIITPSGAAAPFTYEVRSTGAYTIHVGDTAETSAVELDTTLSFRANGRSPVDVAGTFAGGYTDAANAAGTLTAQAQFQRADGPDADVATMNKAIYSVSLLASQTAERAAKKKWQGGKCIEVRVNPGTMMVDQNAAITVMASPHQKFEMVELSLPVVATFKGAKSLTPVNKPVPAPAAFQYVAGNKMGDAGIVELKSTSKRGIGTATVTYTVKCGETEKKMCADQGQGFDPDTCKCACRIDPLIGNISPACKWIGTIHAVANESGQQEQSIDGINANDMWSFSYDVWWSVTGGSTSVLGLTGTASGKWSYMSVSTLQGDSCWMLTKTTDDSLAGSVQGTLIIQDAQIAGQPFRLVVDLDSNGTTLVGTTTWVSRVHDGDSCTSVTTSGPDSSAIDRFYFVDAVPGATTLSGTGVFEGFGLPAMGRAKITVSLDLKLVPL